MPSLFLIHQTGSEATHLWASGHLRHDYGKSGLSNIAGILEYSLILFFLVRTVYPSFYGLPKSRSALETTRL
jgi:hypothetical protein